MTALLTNNLPLLAGAPNGIKKLRELILELAVRGKLVEQDVSDEPASELLKRVAEEKARLVDEGKIKKQKPLAEINEADKPFDVPAGWEWTHLGDLGLVGSSSRVHQKDWQTSGVPFYRAREIVRLSKNGFVDNELFISEALYQEFSAGGSVPKAGDIMLTGVGTIGVPYRVQEVDRFYFKDASVLIFKNHVVDNTSYLLKYFVSPLWIDKIHAESMGTTVHTLTIVRANETLCPLPPLAEQHRIVAKVDELMALCDRLEAQQADADSAHAQLVQALLGSLTQASVLTDKDGGNAGNAGAISGHEFAANWQRLAEHFHTLFSTEPSIDALKQTLLQLAVMGKLVPQAPTDEPASELLKRIQAEKQRLVMAGELKKQKPLDEVREEEKLYSLPFGWEWVRFGTTIKSLSNGLYKPAGFYTDDGVISLRMYNIQDGFISLDGVRRVVVTDGELAQFKLEDGDLLINRVNSKELVGKTAIVPFLDEPLIYESMNMRAKPYVGLVSSLYLNLFMRTSFAKVSLLSHAKEAVGQASLNQGQISSLAMPLPPLDEQHRIVAKLDQLMALCEQLKIQLSQARELNQQLASTLVEQAVA